MTVTFEILEETNKLSPNKDKYFIYIEVEIFLIVYVHAQIDISFHCVCACPDRQKLLLCLVFITTLVYYIFGESTFRFGTKSKIKI